MLDGYARRMLSPVLEARLDDLLAAWRHHNDLRRQSVPIAELARARHVLDDRRHGVYRARRALNPLAAEVEEALATAYCETIDETVFLFATDARWEASQTFTCLCGRDVVAPEPVERGASA